MGGRAPRGAQLGGIVAGIVVLLVVDLSWLGLLLVVLVIGGFELAVARLAELEPSEPEPSEPEPSQPEPSQPEPTPHGAIEPP